MLTFLNSVLWGLLYITLPVVSIVYVFKWWFPDIYIAANYRSKGHSWRSIQLNKCLPYNILCSVCKRLMLSAVGLYCEKCALSACRGCRKLADKKKQCRVATAPTDVPFTHHWVKVGPSCDECEGGLSEGRGNDHFCCWCHRILHCDSGEPADNEVCDFGSIRSMIVPPTCVTINRTGHISVKPPDWPDWRPLVVIVNPKSGGQVGEEVLSDFRGYLNPIQVVILGRSGLRSMLRWIPSSARILVAGGDGSVSAVLTTITDASIDIFGVVSRVVLSPPSLANVSDNLAVYIIHICPDGYNTPAPAIGILPLGTGNDLSRVLGWGGSSSVPLAPLSTMEGIRNATNQTIDRWSVSVGRRHFVAYNYVSIGVDAKVALDFHRARLHPLYLCSSQTFNYFIYLFLGTHQAVAQDCHGLENLLELTLDGEVIPLPPIQALLMLNIPSWGAGVDVWNAGADETVPSQSFNDGKLEVLGINSSFHIAQLQIGLSQPLRLGQGSKATIKLKGNAPMQVDGEPWEQGPCEITIQQSGKASVLCKNITESSH